MISRIGVVHSLFSKVHHCDGDKFYNIDGGEITFSSSEEKQIDAEVIRLQTEYDSQEYARKRTEQYPPLAEQLDLLWHAIDTDTLDNKDYRNKFYTMLKKVKEDNPKG